jgi:Domain of Unknown Function with PDB structure (DUF3857)/Protein of unknown function (DUF2569)
VCIACNAGTMVKIKAEPDWIYPSAADAGRNPEAKDVSNGFYYDLMDRQVNLVNQTVYQHFIRHIINESGVQDASEVSVSFAPQFQQVTFHRILIIRDGKSINRLLNSSIKISDEESEASDYIYNGTRRAYIILKDVQKGDQIEVSYSVTGFNPVFNGLYSGEYYFYSSTPILNYYLSFLTKPEAKPNFKLFNHASAPAELVYGSFKLYQWKNPFLERRSTGSNTPSWYTNSPYVSVSEFSNWAEVADWGIKIFHDYQYPLPEKLLLKMNDWRKESAGDQDMFANLALRFVQNQIRYLGLEIGNYTHQPHSPEYVFDHRFGDCKDKALLLTTILNHEKITAFVALANTDEREHLSEAGPSPTAFNHAIVAIERSNGFVFVDPTISLQRGELINSFIPAYSWALVIKPGESVLSAIEPGFLHYTSVVEDLRVSFEDTSYLGVTTYYKGGAADDIRSSLSKSSLQELNEGFLKYYGKLFESILTDSNLNISDDSLKNIIQINESYKIPALWQKNDDGKMGMNLYAKLMSVKFPDPSDNKGADPISLDYPFTQEYTMRVEMPEDWPLEMTELHIKNNSYQFDFTPVANRNHLVFKYYIKTFRDHIPAPEVSRYKTDYKEILKCLSLWFTRVDTVAPAIRNKNYQPEYNINWMAVWISFFSGVLLTMLFHYLNKKSKIQEERMDTSLPLRGVVILLGITLIIRFSLQGYSFVNENYFSLATWNRLGTVGGSTLHALYMTEMLLAIFSMAGLLSLMYWFFKKRDIFPRMFIYYTVIFLSAPLILLIIYQNLPIQADLTAAKKILMTQFTRMAVYAVIWISFVLKSENVKQTFIYPHDA